MTSNNYNNKNKIYNMFDSRETCERWLKYNEDANKTNRNKQQNNYDNWTWSKTNSIDSINNSNSMLDVGDSVSVSNSLRNSQTFLGKIEKQNNYRNNREQQQRYEFGTFAPPPREKQGGDKRREKFVPPKEEEWELFDEHKQVREGEMFDELCQVYDEAIAVLDCDGNDLEFERLQSFNECEFSYELSTNVQLKNIKKPTPVQRAVIPLIAKTRNDLICHAQTGSGKTAAFLLPIISRLQHFAKKRGIKTNSFCPYCIIVSPTKELVKQLFDDALAFSLNTGVTVSYTFGDIPMKPSVANLQAGCDIFISTCGRLTQFVNDRYISLDELRFLVLDEADKLLKIEDFHDCLKDVKNHKSIYPNHRVLMFSATYEHSINQLVQEFLRDDFIQVQVGQINSAADTVEQIFLKVNKHTINAIKGKDDTLIEFLIKHEKTSLEPQTKGDDYFKVPKTIVFVEKKRQSYRLGIALCYRNIRASCYNSDLTLKMRYEAVSRFATDQCDVLVATDVGARGLNFPNVQYVINYDLPSRDLRGTQNEYIHRIGRTGRVGNVGAAISYFDPMSMNDQRNALYYVKVLKESRQSVPDFLIEVVKENQDRESFRSCSSRTGI